MDQGPFGGSVANREEVSRVFDLSVGSGVRVRTREVAYIDPKGREKGYIISENGAREAGIHPDSKPRGTPGFGGHRVRAIQMAM